MPRSAKPSVGDLADFLADLDYRDVSLPSGVITDPRLFLGEGDAPLEVIVGRAAGNVTAPDLRGAWSKRRGGRAAPVVLVALREGKCSVVAARGNDPYVEQDAPVDQVERLLRAALFLPNRNQVFRFLAASLPEVRSATPGLRNEGLFATHELRAGVPQRSDWTKANRKASSLLTLRDEKLISALGFEVRPLPGPASVLVTRKGAQVAVAVFLTEHEEPDFAGERFGNQSPVTYALAKADETEVGWVIVSKAGALRLYSTRPGGGVGARGRGDTFAEIRLDLLREDQAGYLWLLFSAEALHSGGTAADILASSRRYATDLGSRLRTRIYEDVVPALARALFRAQGLDEPTADQLHETYHLALLVLFRALFVAYAEDRDLLPFRTNEAYRRRALKTKAAELSREVEPSADTTVLWSELAHLFRAIDKGRAEWGVPAYNGGLFSEDPKVSKSGAQLAKLKLPEDDLVHAFRALLTDEGVEGVGPIDFRSLGVRDFGTVYEGLLENELNVAQEDLTTDKDGNYVPCKKKQTPLVHAGEIYLTTSSGKRKETGSFFTKAFVVDHLLDQALEPALDSHVGRLAGMDEREAAAHFFDFKVADLAMGSGHFLVAAIDRIERRLADLLVRRPLAEVRDELARLRARAEESLGPVGREQEVSIEDGQLLRRQIARRCIYGVDLNPDAVELARLSIWVHTFVPGLPLSVLDHHLVVGNSLVGIGSLDEAEELLRERGAMFPQYARKWLSDGAEAATKLARLDEADASEVKKAREAMVEAAKAVRPAVALFDVLTAMRLDPKGNEALFFEAIGILEKNAKKLWKSEPHQAALDAIEPLSPFHLPLAFPDVFSRTRAGFDVILGNPPWEEAQVEEDRFWCRYYPGIQGKRQAEQETLKKKLRRQHPDRAALFDRERTHAEAYRRALLAGGFTGMGRGDPDTYKAFTWRFWHAAAKDGGMIGVVLPRSVFNAKGSADWRREILKRGRFQDLTVLQNSRGWVFDDVHQQYTIALAAFAPEPSLSSPGEPLGARRVHTGHAADRPSARVVPLRGPFVAMDRYLAGLQRPPCALPLDAILGGSDTAAFPLLPTEESAEIWKWMREAPRLDFDDGQSWRALVYVEELHATKQKHLVDLRGEDRDGKWPVYKGESFDLWLCDRGPAHYYGWAKPSEVEEFLFRKRTNSARRRDSPFAALPRELLARHDTLPTRAPRIVYRDVSNRTNARALIACLIPAEVVLANQAAQILWPRGDEQDQAFLLGVLCSIPLDWYVRRMAEAHLSAHVVQPLPVPRPGRTEAYWNRVVVLAGRLAAHNNRLRGWAKKVGVKCGALPEDEKNDMIAELDAVVARLYGLKERQLAHIFETFHEGWDYAERLTEVRRHFRAWGKK